MGIIEGGDPLAVALRDVAALGTDRDRDQIAAVSDRLAAERLRVLVAGEAKRGKSTREGALRRVLGLLDQAVTLGPDHVGGRPRGIGPRDGSTPSGFL